MEELQRLVNATKELFNKSDAKSAALEHQVHAQRAEIERLKEKLRSSDSELHRLQKELTRKNQEIDYLKNSYLRLDATVQTAGTKLNCITAGKMLLGNEAVFDIEKEKAALRNELEEQAADFDFEKTVLHEEIRRLQQLVHVMHKDFILTADTIGSSVTAALTRN